MSAPKHTPGPWHVHENYKGGIPLSVGSLHSPHGSVTVARVDWLNMGGRNGRPSDGQRADAALIAAAPALLAQCQRFMGLLDRAMPHKQGEISLTPEAVAELRAVIEKAGGA